MSRIMRVRSALMSHLHRGMGWRGFCASGASYIRKDDHTAIDINSERRLSRTEVRTYRVSGLVQLLLDSNAVICDAMLACSGRCKHLYVDVPPASA